MKEALAKYKKTVKSGDGEDGVIEEIFMRLGEGSATCVEFGALNGTHDSNTWNLIQTKHWKALLIEADRTYFEKLHALYADNPNVICLNEFVTLDGSCSLDALCARANMPRTIDFLSIDIDGNDYHVWNSLSAHRPRVVSIEFNPTIPNDISFVQPADMRVQQGSSLRALLELAEKKKYTLACVVGTNAFFVVQEEFAALEIPQESLDELYPDTSMHTRVFQLYDGTLVFDGYTTLAWRGIPMDTEKMQALSRPKRVFRNGISANPLMRRLTYRARRSRAYRTIKGLRNLIQ